MQVPRSPQVAVGSFARPPRPAIKDLIAFRPAARVAASAVCPLSSCVEGPATRAGIAMAGHAASPDARQVMHALPVLRLSQ